ncbi:uncharacterized protein LOC134206505 [Armigeres subalbatus]|uniref:uncharacterized protein LOC134206505 n=1 Tax=Armigeres subalbatus TaxID=124917 RepID=UPI002ED0FD1B
MKTQVSRVERRQTSQPEVVDMNVPVALRPVTSKRLLVKLTFTLLMMLISADSRVLKEDLWKPIACDIPGQEKKGVCTAAGSCVAYQRILNESVDNSIEREDFIQRLQCGKFDGAEVCCPESDSYRIGDYEDAARCGQAAYSYRIRGGVIADIDEFPWMAMLLKKHRKLQSLYYHCGGVLISKRFVLTAAHCIVPKIGDLKQDPLKYVRLREYDVYQDPDCMVSSGFMDCSDEKLDMKPRKLIAHPDFTVGSGNRNHDIGLIQIDPVPSYSDFLLPICLPQAGYDHGDRRGKMHNVAGWGKTDFFSGLGSISWSPIKMKVSLPFVAWEVCHDVYHAMGVELQRTQICAGGRKAMDSCAGDSGSPLMHYDMKNAVWVLTGIASFGVRDCGMEGVPGVYTSVKEHLTWIKESISSAYRLSTEQPPSVLTVSTTARKCTTSSMEQLYPLNTVCNHLNREISTPEPTAVCESMESSDKRSCLGQLSNQQPLFCCTSGCTLAPSYEEAPISLIAVEPLPPATISHPGPAFELRDGVFRTPPAGKYVVITNNSLPESIIVSSGTSSSQTKSAANGTPGRFCVTSPKEAPIPPIAVEPLLPASSSRPGPAHGKGDGVFRIPITGKATAPRSKSHVTMYYQNVGGMNGLVEDYRLAVMDHCYDIIVLTETWLDSHNFELYFWNWVRGGGIIIAVSSRLKASVIEDDLFNTVEQVWVSIQLGGRKLFVCAVYIPPDRTRDLELIDTHCRSVFFASEIASPNDGIIVLGDFNLAGVAWVPTHNGFLRPDQEHSSLHPGALKLLDNYSTATLSQVNCIVNENNRLLDLCFVGGRYTAPFISTAPVPLVKTAPHHPSLVIGVENDDVRDYVGTSTAVSYVFRKANYCSIAEVLSNLDWQSILDPADANIAAQTFSHVLAYVIDRHVPKKVTHIDSRVPWMTNDLRSLKRTKKAVLKRFTRFRTLPLKHHYARLNHEYKRLSHFYFKRYQRRIQQWLKSHPKSFWNYVNEQRKEVGLPSSMVYNGVMASTQQEICNLFSAKFASVFVNERLSNDSITSAAATENFLLQPCEIPNENMIGYCTPKNSCTAYQKLISAGPLSNEEQEFVNRLNCSTVGVCCTQRSDFYQNPRVAASDLDSVLLKKCGVDTSGDRIFGGQITAIDEFPWLALLFYQSVQTGMMHPSCGGVLFTKRWVLTAAHCVTGKNYMSLGPLKFVRLGEHNLDTDVDCDSNGDCNEKALDIAVEKAIPHPDYSSTSWDRFNDVALVKLAEAAPYTDFIRHICLPSYYNLTEPTSAVNVKYVAAGWGRTDFYNTTIAVPSKLKLKVSLPHVDHEQCRSVYAEHTIRIADSQICAGGQKAHDTCRGDSGSPLMYYSRQHARWFAYGIVSRGPSQCGTEGVPSIYTNLFKYDNWVRTTIARN